MSPIRIWLNRNYATTIHLLRQLRDNPDGQPVTIVASHADPASPMLAAADEVVDEPPAGSGFADAALDICRSRRVDVFLPVAGQLEVARRRADFAACGTRLICPPTAACEVLGDKAETYRAVATTRPELVPPWRVVRTVDALERACAEFDELWSGPSPLVVKPSRGVGADGVRFLTRSGPDLDELLGPAGLWARADDFRLALGRAAERGREVPELMVMPYLSGPETSVDVLAQDGRVVAAVPRTKVGRRRVVDGPAELLDLTADLVGQFRLDGLVNVQFRQWQGRPALLEINTRPAGGMYQTELAGVNLAWAAVVVALGRPTVLPAPRLGAEYVTVSSLVPLAGQTRSR